MIYDVTLRDNSRFGKLTNSCYFKNISFSFLLVTFSLKANFSKECLCKSSYLRFPGSLKPSCSIYVLFSSEEKHLGALLLFHKSPLKLN